MCVRIKDRGGDLCGGVQQPELVCGAKGICGRDYAQRAKEVQAQAEEEHGRQAIGARSVGKRVISRTL